LGGGKKTEKKEVWGQEEYRQNLGEACQPSVGRQPGGRARRGDVKTGEGTMVKDPRSACQKITSSTILGTMNDTRVKKKNTPRKKGLKKKEALSTTIFLVLLKQGVRGRGGKKQGRRSNGDLNRKVNGK